MGNNSNENVHQESKNPHLPLVLVAGLLWALAGQITAQTFKTLHSFTDIPPVLPYTNSDGAYPRASLVSSGNTLYGTTYYGGSSGGGTVFKVNTDGTGFTTVHNFAGSEGANPPAGLILSGNSLFGTTSSSGSGGRGTVFKVNTDGMGFSTLYNFADPRFNGVPHAGLTMTMTGSTLYGTTFGFQQDRGTVFKVNTDGTGFTNLHSFTSTSVSYPFINNDGADPFADLVLSGNTLYGTTYYGGSSGGGTVFKVNTDGTGFTTLHILMEVPSSGPYTNSDGANPVGGLILGSNILYGTTFSGGSSGGGIVFKVNTDGTDFRVLHNFGVGDGSSLTAGLIQQGDTLYGTAVEGGSSGNGTVFAMDINGNGFTILHSFAEAVGQNNFFEPINSDGAQPTARLFLSESTLYGTTRNGGSSGAGTVFSLSLLPQLRATPSAANVILTWPTNIAGFDYSGFSLQSTTNLVSPAVWTTNSPAPVVVNGQNTVTNPIAGTQQFFRLSQ
jgi:uncharacterized repeat protein (TIGR03803 family)